MATPEQIRAFMKLHGLSQEELAAAIHRSRPTIARILAGQQVSKLVMAQLDEYMEVHGKHVLAFGGTDEQTIQLVAKLWNCTPDEAIMRIMHRALRFYIAVDDEEKVSEAAEDAPPE